MTPLRQRMLDDMQVRNLASNTQASYLQQVSAFAKFFGCGSFWPKKSVGRSKGKPFKDLAKRPPGGM